MRPLLLIATAFGLGCAEPAPATYYYGVPLDEVEFNLYSLAMGVHPDASVMNDPNNPFSTGGLDGDLRWEITAGGLPIAAFYAWASWLVIEPTGEAQFYTASTLHEIYELALCEPEDLPYVRELAIDGYRAVITEFPGSVTYDATGTFAYDLEPSALAGLEALGGSLEDTP